MVSPMREKRAWPPREKDAESAESAAFEATVAVVKETVVRSGEVLVSAQEDLSDHKRWLELQRAAGQADRLRHERWLERQREKQEALARREHAKRRRQLLRQRVARAIENAIFTVVDFVLSAFWLACRQGRSLLQLFRLLDRRRLLLGDRAAQCARCLCREPRALRRVLPRGELRGRCRLDRHRAVGCRLLGRGEIGCSCRARPRARFPPPGLRSPPSPVSLRVRPAALCQLVALPSLRAERRRGLARQSRASLRVRPEVRSPRAPR